MGIASSDQPDNQLDVYLLVLAPFSDQHIQPLWDGGHYLVPAVQLAVQEINNRTDLLEGFHLIMIVANSGCDIQLEARVSQVEHLILGPKRLIGVVGPACSEAATATASLQELLSSVQITTATSSILDSHDKYPFTFGSVASSRIYVDAIFTLMNDRGWERVAVLYQINRQYHVLTYNDFLKKLPSDYIVFASGITDTYMPLSEVFNSGARIVVVFASNGLARELLCLAHHKNLVFPSFQFIFTDRQSSRLITPTNVSSNRRLLNCSIATMERSINGSIYFNYDLSPLVSANDTLLVSGEQYDTFVERYMNELSEYSLAINQNLSSTASPWSHPYYDSTWALALSANACLPELSDDIHHDCIHENMYAIKFRGTTGTVEFSNETGHASTIISITQVVSGNDDVLNIGHYNAAVIMYEEEGIFIEDSFEPHVDTVPLAISVFVGAMSILALVVTLFFHAINVFKRHYHSIKASSPTLNNLVFVGCYLLVAALTLFNVWSTYPFTSKTVGSVLCNATVWSLSIAYTLIFGTIGIKCWRLYRIFKHTFDSRTGSFFTNTALFGFVMTLLATNILILLIVTLVAPVKVKHSATLDTSEATPLMTSETYCQYSWGYFVPLALFKGLLATVVVFFAIHNRHIKLTDFRHTKAINILAYSLTLMFGLGVPLYIVLRVISFTYAFVVLCILILSMIYLSLFLLFFNPTLPLLKKWFCCKQSNLTPLATLLQQLNATLTAIYHINDSS